MINFVVGRISIFDIEKARNYHSYSAHHIQNSTMCLKTCKGICESAASFSKEQLMKLHITNRLH